MKISTVNEAIFEAGRFVLAAGAALANQEAAQRIWDGTGNYEYWPVCAENAACKRSSLDLSRALARMRRS